MSIECFATKAQRIKSFSPEVASSFLISKIDSVNSYYVIYAEDRGGGRHKIVSEKQTAQGKTLKVGGHYRLKLYSMRHEDVAFGNLRVDGIGFDDSTTIMAREDGCINDLFYSKQLKGLHLIEQL